MTRAAAAGILFVGLAIDVIATEGPHKITWRFDEDPRGGIPRGFTELVGSWKVVESQRRKVLSQTAKNSDPTFNLILADKPMARDLDLSVKLRPIDGQLDRGGGLVWRAKDAKNYYVARYNPLENNFRIYKVEGGKRTMFQNAEVAPGEGWRTLRVTMTGDHITCRLDGKTLLDVHDATFPEAGRIGLWSKSDAQTEFDELSLEIP